MDMCVEVLENGVLYLRFGERMDMVEGDSKWEEAKKAVEHLDHHHGVIIDLKHVDFISSGGFSWLIIEHKRCTEAGSRLVLTNISPLILQTIKVMNLHKVFTIAENEQAATKVFEAA